MRPTILRAVAVVLPLVLTSSLHAQMLAHSESSAPAACASNNRLWRSTGGALLGAWVGFVGAKISVSDWSAKSHTAAGQRLRFGATLGGAILGASIGGSSRLSGSCGAPRRVAPMRPRMSDARKPISVQEIERSGINGSAYDLVYTLRRNWLNTRGLDSQREATRVITGEGGTETVIPGEPELIIYLDNVKLGTISQLHAVPVAGIQGVRYFDPAQAMFRWGAGHARGAIQILTTRRING